MKTLTTLLILLSIHVSAAALGDPISSGDQCTLLLQTKKNSNFEHNLLEYLKLHQIDEKLDHANPPKEYSAMVDFFFNLNSQESAIAKTVIDKHYTGQKIPTFFRIALGDQSEIIKYFSETITGHYENYRLLTYYRPFLDRMSEPTRQELLHLIANKYPTASKNTLSLSNNAIEEKRMLDAWIRVLIPGEKIFNENYQITMSPMKAYQAYLNQIKKDLLDKMPHPEDYGGLKASQLRLLAREIQKFINDPLTARQFRSTDFKAARFFIMGSVVKGLNRDGSDIDILHMNLEMNSPTEKDFFSELEISLTGVINKNIPERAFSFNWPLDPREQWAHAAFNNAEYDLDTFFSETFMLEVTQQNIDLIVRPLPVKKSGIWPMPDFREKIIYQRYALKS